MEAIRGEVSARTVHGKSLRFFYGFGLSAEGIKNNAFNAFLLFYYQQVAGLDPLLCGAALFLALCVDAVTDPWVGLWSDGVTSRLGRRHPFMFASGLPLAASFIAVFNPPAAMSSAATFAWLLLFAVLTRLSMTLFAIPHQALLAELSHDYDERTALQALRTVFAWLFGLANATLAYTVFLKPPAGAPPSIKYDPEGFLPFALWGGCAMLVATQVSAVGTLKAAREVAPTLKGVKRTGLLHLFSEMRTALDSAAYRTVVLAGLFAAIAYGVAENLGYYMNLYFWGFSSEQVAVFLIVIAAASVAAMVVARVFAGRFGKHRVAAVGALVTAVVGPGVITLKLLGFLPPSGSRELMAVLMMVSFFVYLGIIVAMIMVGTMIADITDEHDLRTGLRQEGLLFSAQALIAKAASGFGALVAGVVVKLAEFPRGATADNIDAVAIRNLGVFSAVVGLVLSLSAAWVYSRYRLTRARHTEILDALATRHA